MKILKIEFQNINSLQGKHTIDFTAEPFYGHSLFAITGPTGAGKSTILDVITLALFNEIPRLDRISKSEIESKGAILTRGQNEAWAKVTYELESGSRYISEWNISINRNGNLRDYDMQLSNADTGEIMAEKKSEIPAKNEALIGLKYNQFVKSVILAQGAFAEFLKVNKRDRAELLEKITGTEIYRQLGFKAYERYKVFKYEIEDRQKTIHTFKDELLEDEQVEELELLKINTEKEIEGAENQLKISEEKIKLKNKIKEQKDTLNKLEAEKNKNIKEIQDFENNQGKLLRNHLVIAPFEDALKSWKNLNQSLIDNQQKLKINQQKADKISREKKEFLKLVSGLINIDISESEVMSQLAEFEREIIQLQRKYDDLKEKGVSLKNEINASLQPIALKIEKNYKQCQIDFKNKLNKAQQSLAQNPFKHLQKHEIKSQLNLISDERDSLVNAKALSENIRNTENTIREKEFVVRENHSETESLPPKIENLATKHTLVSKELENLNLKKQNILLYSSLEEKRKDLKDGEPCPLCGSLHHPLLTDFDHVPSEIDAEINSKKKEERNLQNQLTELKSKLTSLEEIAKKTNDDLQNENEKLKKLKTEFAEKYRYNLDAAWDELILQKRNDAQLINQFSDDLTTKEILENVIPKLENIIKVSDEAIHVRDSLRNKYNSEINIQEKVKELEEQWNEISSDFKINQNLKSEIQSEIQQLQARLNPLHLDLTDKISSTIFKEIPQAFSALLSFEKRTALQQELDKLTRKSSDIQTTEKTLMQILEKDLELDDPRSYEEIEMIKKELSDSIKTKKTALEEHKRLLVNQEENHKRIKGIEAEIAEMQEKSKYWKLLNDMIGDATGHKFNQFAQDLTLIQLIQLANLRLEKLSKRYLIANPAENEDDSLVVIDLDMGDQRRSVKTLSGGETFVISLALALALSDLASSNVRISSLFIDEGFGTLDPETLDQVLTTLEQLQEEGSKMVGIISHVGSLKERISTQIQLIPNGRGFSRLEIKG